MRSSSRAAKSRASFQETAFPRNSGVVSRSGEYCSGRKLFVRQQRNPWVTGCEGSPPSWTTRPFSTCATTEQASGQSRLQTVLRIAGLWPILDLGSFMKVTGPKFEGWLPKGVGACMANIGAALGAAGLRGKVARELRILGVSTALSFAAMDFWYAALRRRISRVYLLN